MRTADSYSPEVATLALVAEHNHMNWEHRAWYLDRRFGETEAWLDACDHQERAAWWHEQVLTLYPGATDCPHGLSVDNCYHPIRHYDDSY